MSDLAARFRNPPAVFRPVPFWSLNETLEPQEMRRQVREFHAGGWGGVCLHSRVGLLTPYLGKAWFEACGAAIEECEKLGMYVVLYDEDKWPSGFSGGSVPLADPSYRMKVLFARMNDQAVPEGSTALVKGANSTVYRWQSPLGNAWFNGTCYGDLMHEGAMKKFCADGYEPYFQHFSKHFGKTILGTFTDEPCAIMRNILPGGAVPYTDALPARYQELFGEELLPRIHLLFNDGPGAKTLRLRYYRAANDLFEGEFSKRLGSWCAEHGIAWTGHFMSEWPLSSQQEWGVNIMPNYRHQGWPGIDHLCRSVEERVSAKQCHSVVNQYGKPRMLSEMYGVAGATLSFADRWWIAGQQIALGVNVINPHLSLYCMAGCRKRDYPQNISYQQPYWPLNHVVNDALSRLCTALSEGTYHPEVLILHPQESVQAQWQARIERDPKLGAELVAWESGSTDPETREPLWALDRGLRDVTDALGFDQRTYDFGNETILSEVASIKKIGKVPHLVVGKMVYPAVVIPPGMITMRPTTLKLLEKFLKAGGIILRTDRGPSLVDGKASKTAEEFLAKIEEVPVEALAARLAVLVPPLVRITNLSTQNRRILTHLRDLDNGDRLVYLSNLGLERGAESFSLRLEGGFGSVWRLDPETGEEIALSVERDGKVLIVSLPLAPAQVHLLRLTKKSAGKAVISALPTPARNRVELPITAWKAERLDANTLTLDSAFFRLGNGAWSERPLPIIVIQDLLNRQKYTGPLTLAIEIDVETAPTDPNLRLVVEHADRIEISVNGTASKYIGKDYWLDIRWLPVSVAGMFKVGKNRIELLWKDFRFGNLAEPHDQAARYGSEIESLYLVGEFAVTGKISPFIAEKSQSTPSWISNSNTLLEAQHFLHDQSAKDLRLVAPRPIIAGDATAQGLPFYAGRLRRSITLPTAVAEGRWRLRLEHLDCPIAEIALGGKSVGHIWHLPYSLDLPANAQGELSITLYGTLRNLMGPHHEPKGETINHHPGSFIPWMNHDFDRLLSEWLSKEQLPDNWRANYCVVGFGNLGTVHLERFA